LLKQHFANHRTGYSLVYLLSNALYLPDLVLSAIGARSIPIVLNQNGVFYPAWYADGWEAENGRMASAYQRASHVFWQSEFCRRCADRFLGARAGGGEVLFNAVDTERFRPAEAAETSRRARPFTLLLTGKIGASTAYRLTSSIEGLSVARRGGIDAVLTIAGAIAPAAEAEARALIDQLGLAAAVRFTGAYSGQQAPDIYRSADAYLMIKQNDPCPNVVIEALACGLPVLYSASGGVPELVGQEAGVGLPIEESFEHVIVPEAAAIADGLAHLVADRDAMAAAARRRAVEKFGLPGWIGRHSAVFEQLVAKGAVNA
jgi:glycosyltransferase involved in cell wall biosynthesis